MSEPPSTWRIDPFEDMLAGKGNNVFYGVWGHLFVANNQLCPPDNCPKSYKDLADPRFRGMILLDEPLPGGSAGTKFTSYTYLEYGEEYLRDVAANVAGGEPSERGGAKTSGPRGVSALCFCAQPAVGALCPAQSRTHFG